MFFRPRNWPLVGKILEIGHSLEKYWKLVTRWKNIGNWSLVGKILEIGVKKTKAFVKYHSLIKIILKKKTLFKQIYQTQKIFIHPEKM